MKEAWVKWIKLADIPIYFDHDYAVEVVHKRKTYTTIKKILKEKAIRFQTPLTKIQIHWPEGPRLYSNAHEAANKMRKRGIEIQMEEPAEDSMMEEWIQGNSQCIRVSGAGKQSGVNQCTRGKLQELQRTEEEESTGSS